MAKDASFRAFIIVDDSTIRETRDRQEKRPRKRARVHSDEDDEQELISTKSFC